MPELFGGNARAGFEGLDKIGDIVEAASIGDLGDAEVFFFGHQFGGMTDPEFIDEIDKGFLCALFEKAAKRLRRQVAIAGNFFQCDMPGEMFAYIPKYFVDFVIVFAGVAVLVADTGQLFIIARGGQQL